MLGLNRKRTLYTITAIYYKFKGVENNKQTWEVEGHKFKCNYSAQVYVETTSSNQGTPKPSVVIETTSNIDFKIHDRISINNVTFLVKDVTRAIDYMSAKYTNKPRDFIQTLTLE